MIFKQHLARLTPVLAVAAAATAGPLVGGATSASAAPNDAVIANNGGLTMTICRSLQNDTTCGNTTGVLNPGENSRSKFAWADADAVYAPRGCRVQIESSRGWNDLGASGPRWVKIGGQFGATTATRLKCDG